ncbi:hypothetical protein GOV14_00105 [Candidatus Pacearchaeota archaeon]|nr:hypothetical protein [Candidatus Pacearchaeota archaeon]
MEVQKFKIPKGAFFRQTLGLLIFIIIFLSIFITLLTLVLLGNYNPVIILFGLFSGCASFFSIVAYTLGLVLPKNVVLINEKSIQIPRSGWKGYHFPEFQGQGYEWVSTRKLLIVSSLLNNINNVYKVTDKKEKESVKKNRALYGLTVRINIGPFRMRIAEIPKIVKDWKEKKTFYLQIIKNAFKYNYAMDVNKTVAITFKKMEFVKHAFEKQAFGGMGYKYDEFMKKIMPKTENMTVYVSVEEPDRLVEAIKKRVGK